MIQIFKNNKILFTFIFLVVFLVLGCQDRYIDKKAPIKSLLGPLLGIDECQKSSDNEQPNKEESGSKCQDKNKEK